MPVYEYSCKKCGKIFDKLLKASERDKKIECPDCGNIEVERTFSVFGVGGNAGTKGGGTLPCGVDSSNTPACGGG